MPATIGRFQVVSTDGISDSKSAVTPLDTNGVQPGLGNAHSVLGVTMADSNAGNPVGVMSSGVMRAVVDILSEGWAVGDLLWAYNSTPSKSRRPAPEAQVYVGRVIQDNGDSTYEVDVNVRLLPQITELTGVAWQTALPDRSVLIYRDSDNAWHPSSPNQTVEVNTSYSPTTDEVYLDTILCDASGGWFTVTLPFDASWPRRFTIKKIDASRNVVLLASSGYEPIEGGNPTLRLKGESLTVQSDSIQWWVI